MKGKSLPFIGLILLIACLVVSFFYVAKLRTNLPEELQIIRKEFQLVENQILKNNSTISDIKLSQERDIKNLSELNCNGCLFFRYSELSCKTCVDETIQIMKESLGIHFMENKLVVLVESSSARITRVFKEINGLENVEVWLTTDSVISEIEAFYTPYFFILDESMRITSLKIVIQQLPVETKSYLRTVRKSNRS